MDLLKTRLVSRDWNEIFNIHNISTEKYRITLNDSQFNQTSEIVKFLIKHSNMAGIISLDSIDFIGKHTIDIIKVWGPIAKHVHNLQILNCKINTIIFEKLFDFTSNNLEHLEIVQNNSVNKTLKFNSIRPFKNLNNLKSISFIFDKTLPEGLIHYILPCNEVLPNLQNISLLHSNEIIPEIEFDPDSWCSIQYFIDQRKTIKLLKFNGIKLNARCYADLKQMSSSNYKLDLKELKIKQINCEHLESTIKEYFRSLTNLETLGLCSMALTNRDFREIFEDLPKLRHLELSGIRRLGIRINSNDPQLPSFQNLESLVILSDIIHYCDMKNSLGSADNNTLKTLNFVGQYNPDEGHGFFESFGFLKNIKELSLGSSYLNIGDVGLQLILKNLANPELLERFVLTHSNVK